jgi:hypothetical protein
MTWDERIQQARQDRLAYARRFAADRGLTPEAGDALARALDSEPSMDLRVLDDLGSRALIEAAAYVLPRAAHGPEHERGAREHLMTAARMGAQGRHTDAAHFLAEAGQITWGDDRRAAARRAADAEALCGNCGTAKGTSTRATDSRTNRLCDPCIDSHDWSDWIYDCETRTYTHKPDSQLTKDSTCASEIAGAQADDTIVRGGLDAGRDAGQAGAHQEVLRKGTPQRTEDTARRPGAGTAQMLITRQAGAGMAADRIDEHHHDLAASLFSSATTADGLAFAEEYDRTAETLVSELRQLERPEPDRSPGAPHPDPQLAAKGWQACEHGHGVFVRARDREADRTPHRRPGEHIAVAEAAADREAAG